MRQCVSLARFVLDPLIEICHLCNNEDDILFINFYPLQSEVSKKELLFTLQMECINRVNEVLNILFLFYKLLLNIKLIKLIKKMNLVLIKFIALKYLNFNFRSA